MRWILPVLVSALAACGGSSGTSQALDLAALCPLVETEGCTARSTFDICEVDGGQTTCHDACAPDEVALDCAAAPGAAIPAPSASAGCRVIPIPTTSGALHYCCPCGT